MEKDYGTFLGYSVTFKKPKGKKLFNVLVETENVLEASKRANEWMQKNEKTGFKEYGISKHEMKYKYTRSSAYPVISWKGCQVLMRKK